MKRNTGRILSMLLIAALLITSFAGCSNSGSPSTTTAAGATAAAGGTTAAPPVNEKPVEISYVSWNCGEYEGDTWIEQYVEGKLNIELDVLKVNLGDTQAMELMLASDEFPDCGWVLQGAKTMQDNGLIRTIPKDMIRTYAPNFAAEYDKTFGAWELNLDEETGEPLSLVGILGEMTAAGLAECYRLDWLEAIGILPEGELVEIDDRMYYGTVPFTNEQLLTILEKFTTEDPDGNGEDDTYGWMTLPATAHGWAFTSLRERYGYHVVGYYYDDAGVIQYPYATEGFREYLRVFSMIYQNGWVDPEFATNDWATYKEKMKNGVAGYVSTAYGYGDTWAADRHPRQVLAENPDAKVVFLPYENKITTVSEARAGYPFYVNRKVDDEKLAKILEFVDYCHFSDDYITIKFGEEGTHWEYAEPETKTFISNHEGITSGNTGIHVFATDYVRPQGSPYYDLFLSAADKKGLNMRFSNELKQYESYPDKADLYNVLDYELSQQYNPSISAIVDEFFYDCISGEKNADEHWEQYLADLEKAGYEKLRADLENLPDFSEYINE